MKHRILAFFEALRASSESRKRRWAAGLSAVSMIFVFLIWFAALQATAMPLDAALREKEKRPSAFLETMKVGSAILWNTISSYIGREREITIERKEFTFTPKDTPAVPVRELPAR